MLTGSQEHPLLYTLLLHPQGQEGLGGWQSPTKASSVIVPIPPFFLFF